MSPQETDSAMIRISSTYALNVSLFGCESLFCLTSSPTQKKSLMQMHNLIAWQATTVNLQVYFWIHSDVVVLPRDISDNNFADKLLASISHLIVEQPNWAVAFFAYDWFAAFNPVAVAAVPWDEHYIQNYKTDCE